MAKPGHDEIEMFRVLMGNQIAIMMALRDIAGEMNPTSDALEYRIKNVKAWWTSLYGTVVGPPTDAERERTKQG